MKETDTLGWRGFTELEADQRYFRFKTRKTLKAEIKQFMDHAWSLYCDGDAYKKGHLGDNCEFFQQVLQEISPDLLIIQRVQKYPSLVQMTHALAIAFRMQTDNGYMLVYRCIESPRLQNLLTADGLSMCGTFAWETYEVAHRNGEGECDEVRFTATGSVGADDPTYAMRWRDEMVDSLARYENECMNKPTQSMNSRTEEDSGVTSESKATHS